MKRVIEKRNLAFNQSQAICDLCKRWKGEFTENDRRVCNYNKDDKGLQSGRVIDFMQNFKCKYYKRDTRYNTCSLQSKNYTTGCMGVIKRITIKRGKVYIKKVDSL